MIKGVRIYSAWRCWMSVENNQVAMNNRPNNNIASYTMQINRTRSLGALSDENAADAMDGGGVWVVFKTRLQKKLNGMGCNKQSL